MLMRHREAPIQKSPQRVVPPKRVVQKPTAQTLAALIPKKPKLRELRRVELQKVNKIVAYVEENIIIMIFNQKCLRFILNV